MLSASPSFPIRLVAILLATIASSAAADEPLKLVPGGPQTIYAPVSGLREFARWQLAVVNRSTGSMAATITPYAMDGSPVFSTQILLTGKESRVLDLKTLVPPAVIEHGIGGIAVSFNGQSMGVGAQVTISGYQGFGNVDAPVFPDMMYKSNTADAIWWEPADSRSYLVLGNSSANALQVKVTASGGKVYDLTLSPHAHNHPKHA